MSSDNQQEIWNLHFRTIEGHMATLADTLAETNKSLNRLIARDEARLEIDKRVESDIESLKKFKEDSEDIIKQAGKDQAFMAGLKQKVVYTVIAGAIFGIASYGGILIYDNAGQKQKTEQVGK